MVEHSYNIIVLLAMIAISGLGIGGYALINSSNFKYHIKIKFGRDIRIEHEINKGKDT